MKKARIVCVVFGFLMFCACMEEASLEAVNDSNLTGQVKADQQEDSLEAIAKNPATKIRVHKSKQNINSTNLAAFSAESEESEESSTNDEDAQGGTLKSMLKEV